jgi:GTP cyclohydrolase IA
MLTEI